MRPKTVSLLTIGVLTSGLLVGILIGQQIGTSAFAADKQYEPVISRPLTNLSAAIDTEAIATYQFLIRTLEQLQPMEDLLHAALAEYNAGTLTLADLENYYYPTNLGLAGAIEARMPRLYSIPFSAWTSFLCNVRDAWDDAGLYVRCFKLQGVDSYLRNGLVYIDVFRNHINAVLAN
jgi:hypothetical protein